MEPTSPFDDPDVQAAMRQAGVVHRPGLAEEMMAELAPLLAADGIDLNDPDADYDLDQLNAALQLATERHNMELSTPVGEQRSRTLSTLREISDAIQRDDVARAERIFDAVGPEVSAGRPSAAQLLGTSMELLDSWHSQDPTRAHLRGLNVPRWLERGRPVAPDLLALARKGRARASLDRLILNHGGLVVAHAGAMLVAASLIRLAEQENQDYAQLAVRYLSGASPSDPRASSGSGSAFGPAAAAAVSSQNLTREYRRWLGNQPGSLPEVADAQAAALKDVLDLVTAEGIDPQIPEEFDYVLDIVDASLPEPHLDQAYELLDSYVHFRLETEPSTSGWEEAHELITESLSLDDDGGASAALLDAVRETEDLDDGQRRAVLEDLPLVSATRALLDWLGTSQPITQSGMPRRADIGTVAAFIGIAAEGAARQPKHDWEARTEALGGPVSERPRVSVQSAKEIPELVAWWNGLEDAGMIELTTTRVRPGPEAASLTAGDGFSLTVADELISSYVAGILTSPLDASRALAPFDRPIVMQTVMRVVEALVPDSPQDDEPENPLQSIFQMRTQEELRRLEVAGLLDLGADGHARPVVPLELRTPVMIGVMTASALMEAEEE